MGQVYSHPPPAISYVTWLIELVKNKAPLCLFFYFALVAKTFFLLLLNQSQWLKSNDRVHHLTAQSNHKVNVWPLELFPLIRPGIQKFRELSSRKIFLHFDQFATKSTDMFIQTRCVLLRTMASFIAHSTKSYCAKTLLFSLF